MPFSYSYFDLLVAQHVKSMAPTRVLDVGVGAGKHGKIVRASAPAAKLEGLEPTEAYIDKFQLAKIYDTVHVATVQEFIATRPRENYDLIVAGDILEHLFRSEIVDVLDFLLYRSRWIMVLWPTNMPQNDEYDNNMYEVHKSNFKISDLAAVFDVHFYQKTFCWFQNRQPQYNACEYHYCVLRGHTAQKDARFM